MTLHPMVRWVLWPLSLLYGEATGLRVWLYARGLLKRKRLNRPVISVGNLTVGGTGKTPMVLWLAERLLAEGRRVAILSRGYKGSSGTSDEVQVMKYRLQERVRFGVGPNRFEEGKPLEAYVDVFLLDDGFQHLQLAREADLLLIDATRSLGSERVLPAGRLREPLSAMARADFLVFTRTRTAPGTFPTVEKRSGHSVFYATTLLRGYRRYGAEMGLLPPEELDPGPYYAFCGIGNPSAFFLDLRNWNVSIAGVREFADHHRYDQGDLRELTSAARQTGARALLTTEKDAQNLPAVLSGEMPVYVAVIEFSIHPEDQLLAALREKIGTGSPVP